MKKSPPKARGGLCGRPGGRSRLAPRYSAPEFVPFCERVGLKLEPFQRKIAKAAAAPEREFVRLIPRGSGKTTLLAVLAYITSSRRRASGLRRRLLAPTDPNSSVRQAPGAAKALGLELDRLDAPSAGIDVRREDARGGG